VFLLSSLVDVYEIPTDCFNLYLRRVLQNPLDQSRNAKSCCSAFLITPNWARDVNMHPLNLLINKLQKHNSSFRNPYQLQLKRILLRSETKIRAAIRMGTSSPILLPPQSSNTPPLPPSFHPHPFPPRRVFIKIKKKKKNTKYEKKGGEKKIEKKEIP
jgi:hypothetical protein